MNTKQKTYLQSSSFQLLENWSVQYLLETKFSYNDSFKLVNIGAILSKSRQAIQIEDEKNYQRVTVKINNNGVEPRDIEDGKNIGTKKQYLVKPGQFLMSKIDARNGAFGIVPEKLNGAIVTNDFPVFDINIEVINPDFFVLITSTKEFIKFAQSCSSGTTNRQRIDINSFLNVKIPLPSSSTQKRIIENYNSKIKLAKEQEDEVIELERNIGNYLYQILGINQTSNNKEKKLFSTIAFKEVDRWAVESLGKFSRIGELFQGKYPLVKLRELIHSCQYGLSEKSSKEQIGPPMLRMNNIFNSELTVEDLKYIKIEDSTLQKYILNKGDLLFNRTNSKELVGKTALFDQDGDFTFASYLIRVVLNESKVDRRYINYLFNSSILQYQKDLVSRQITGQANINAQEMQDFLFPIPPIEEQKKLADKIDSIREEIADLKFKAAENRKQAQLEFENEIFTKITK